jgi:hypothetical protein
VVRSLADLHGRLARPTVRTTRPVGPFWLREDLLDRGADLRLGRCAGDVRRQVGRLIAMDLRAKAVIGKVALMSLRAAVRVGPHA